MNKESYYFDQYQRYQILSNIINLYKKVSNDDKINILDVGGAGIDRYGKRNLPLKEFLKNEDIKVLDIVDGYENFEDFINGSGDDINYKDNSFDFVVSNDTLEHIPPHQREAFISELLRVSKKYLFSQFQFIVNKMLLLKVFLMNSL